MTERIFIWRLEMLMNHETEHLLPKTEVDLTPIWGHRLQSSTNSSFL